MLYFRIINEKEIEFYDDFWNIKGKLGIDLKPVEKCLHFTELEFYKNASIEIKKQLRKANYFLDQK